MAIKHLLCLALCGGLMLCGCGNPFLLSEEQMQAATGSNSAGETVPASGSASESVSGSASEGTAGNGGLVDPPLDDSVTQDDQTSQPLLGLVICLDPGHGITNSNAQERISPLSQQMKVACVSGASGAAQTEEEVNLAVAELTQTELQSLGAKVVMTRTTHEATIGNRERAQIANDAGADLCIRIHADGSEDSSVHGMSMQVPSGELLGTPSIEQSSRTAGEILLAAVTEATGAKSLGLTPRSDLTGFNWSEVPCVLLEMGFLSNADEDTKLASAEYRQEIADGIAAGVCRWAAAK